MLIFSQLIAEKYNAMKKITTFSVFLLCCFVAISQCPTTNIEMFSQEEIDNFSTNYPNCTTLTHELKIDGEFNTINNLNGLSEIINAQDIFIIETEITSLNGLHNIESISSLALWFNMGIQNLNGLSSLVGLGSLEVWINNSITSLEGLDSIQSINNVNLFSNTSLSDISQLNFLTSIGNLSISGNGLTNLNGLQNINDIEGDLIISNEQLHDFEELIDLQSIGGSLRLMENPEIENVSAFSNLESVDELYIVDNQNLINFSGFENLTTVTGTLRIGFNPGITNLSFVKNIISVGYLDIYENENLQTLQGIESIKYIEERLFIESNPNLTSIVALSYMEIPSDINEVVIINNESLQACGNDFICSIIDDESVSKYFVNNAQGCNSIIQVNGSCNLIGTDTFIDSPIIYPNPVSDFFTISMDENMKLINTQIYSALGMLIYETNKSNINLSSFKTGVYSIKIITDKGVFDRKIIKE